MLTMLSIIIGIVFVMLLFSLLASTLMEFLAGLLSLRGKHLLNAIKSMVGDLDEKFENHPYYQQLAIGGKLNKKQPALPSYINSGTFSAILADLLDGNPDENIGARIQRMKDSPLKQVLSFLHSQTNGEVGQFRQKTEEWYNEIMDRASGAYKRKSRHWLIGIGLGIAVVFNVDPLDIYHSLSMNASLTEYIADMATDFSQNQTAPAPSANVAEARDKIASLVNDNISAISTPLGLGWAQIQPEDMNPSWWLYKIVGWLTTALALSLGASFWFDALRQLVSLRASGPPASNTSSTSGNGLSYTGGSFLTKSGSDSPDTRSAAKPKSEK